jgi:O-antigen ligase
VSRLGTDDISTGRVAIWGLCQKQIEASPWFGSGPNTITRMFGLDNFSSTTPFHCHNQVLDDIVNFGWVAGLIPTAVLLTCIIWAVRSREISLSTILLTLLACWLVESPFRLFATQPSAFLNLFVLLLLSKSLVSGSEKSELMASKTDQNTKSKFFEKIIT